MISTFALSHILVEDAFEKLDKEFNEIKTDSFDKSLQVIHTNLRKALERKRDSVLKVVDIRKQISLSMLRSKKSPTIRQSKSSFFKEEAKAIRTNSDDCIPGVKHSHSKDDEQEVAEEGVMLRYESPERVLKFNNKFANANSLPSLE